MGNIKQIKIKNRKYYFFNDMINIENYDSSLLKINKKSYKNIGIFYIGYIAIKSISDYENVYSVNPLYLIIGETDGCTQENNGNKYLSSACTDENKKVLETYTKLWEEIKYHIQTINSSKSNEYEKNYIKIKFISDDDFPLNKILQVFLDECLYEV